jgi:hypothetical protein
MVQRTKMTAANRIRIAAAEARRIRAERAALAAEIRLAVLKLKCDSQAAAHGLRLTAEVHAAVKALQNTGQIRKHDPAAALDMAGQFVNEPELISLALQRRIYRARTAKADSDST